jgi:hypothetical protein
MNNIFRKCFLGLLAGIGSILGFADNSEATPGRLDILNHLDFPYTNQWITLIQMSGALEGKDSYDSTYTNMGVDAKIISIVEGHPLGELDLDARPEESMTPFNLELSVITAVVSPNCLWLDMPRVNYNFGNKTLTLQQYNFGDPTIAYPVYDIRKEIVFGQDPGYGRNLGMIPLPDLKGDYGSEIPYAYFRVDFDRNLADFDNNGTVDLKDFVILAEEFGKTGNSLADIAISNPENAVYLSPNTTPYFDGVVDLSDLVKFSENWLVTYRFKAPAPIEGTSNE